MVSQIRFMHQIKVQADTEYTKNVIILEGEQDEGKRVNRSKSPSRLEVTYFEQRGLVKSEENSISETILVTT